MSKLPNENESDFKAILNSMTIDELKDLLKPVDPEDALGFDKEVFHKVCDDAIREILRKLGREDIAELYKKASEHFWYS